VAVVARERRHSRICPPAEVPRECSGRGLGQEESRVEMTRPGGPCLRPNQPEYPDFSIGIGSLVQSARLVTNHEVKHR